MGSSPSKPPFDPYNQPWMYDPAYAWKRGSLVGKAYMEAIKNGANNQEGGGLAGFGNEPTNDPFGGGNVNNPFGGGNANNPSSRGQANAQNIANPWMANESEFNQATNTPFVEPNRGGSRIGPSILRLSALGSQMVGQVPTAGPTQFSHTGGGGGRDLNHGGRNDALEPGGQTMGGLHVRGHEGESVYPTSGRISGASGSPGPGYHASSRSINDGRGSGRGGSSSRTNRGPASGYRRGTSRGRGNNANIPRPGGLAGERKSRLLGEDYSNMEAESLTTVDKHLPAFLPGEFIARQPAALPGVFREEQCLEILAETDPMRRRLPITPILRPWVRDRFAM
ncbi:hypothetical protein P154DRAFT_625425 [Amniculicola lignicola CBS 123094]|uniref:Uncharacterized protein n=1 Tax=Amniculicola lignicola CBS 123094 TaxID=1392246 RepID=A0A6A5VX57_9PLEO|nr:hypothetical protein P154DRAFT_625425 [Amniculicola lignicola CBS 123094]